MKLDTSYKLSRNILILNFFKFRKMRAELFRAERRADGGKDRQTDVTKLTVTF